MAIAEVAGAQSQYSIIPQVQQSASEGIRPDASGTGTNAPSVRIDAPDDDDQQAAGDDAGPGLGKNANILA